MNKKAFTLAEILGVIVVISLLLLLIMPTIINKISENGDKAGNANNDIIFSATDNYLDESAVMDTPGSYCITIRELIDSGKLVEPVTDVQTGEDISDKTVYVETDGKGNTTHKIMETSECKADSDIYRIRFVINPSGNKWVHARDVTIVYPKFDEPHTYQYRIDGGEWIDNEGGNIQLPTFTKISTLEARTVGSNILHNNVDIINIDNEIPKINSLSVAPDSKINIKAIDEVSGLSGYYISTKNETPDPNDKNWVKINVKAGKESSINVPKKEGTYYVWVKDKADNVSSNNNNSITLKNRKVTATFIKGPNVDSINSSSKSCTILAGNDSCQITLPNIVPSKAYVTDGWYDGNTKVGKAKEKYNLKDNITLTSKSIEDVITINLSTTSKTNKITAIASATALSDIVKYEFSIDGKKWVDVKLDQTHTFTKLTQGKTYTIYVRVTSESGKVETKTKTATTTTIPLPTFKETNRNASQVTVTITYPDGCGSEFTCTYKKDDGTEVEVTTKTVNVKFTEDGNVTAKVSDGTNNVSSSYNVVMYIDATYHSGYYYCPSGYTQSGSGSSMTCYMTTSKQATFVPSSKTCTRGSSTPTYDNCGTSRHQCGVTSSTFTLSGNTCHGNWVQIRGRVDCQGPTYICATRCSKNYDECDDSYSENGPPACEGLTGTSYQPHYPTVKCRNNKSPTTVSAHYECSSGYTLSGTRCYKTVYRNPSYQSSYYSCPSGYKLSGTKCYPN